MAREGLARLFPPLDIISEREVRAIKKGTLEVLERTGVVVEDPAIRSVMAAGGCKVENGSDRVRIPKEVAEERLRTCPSQYLLKAREDADDVLVKSGGDAHFMASCGMGLLNLETLRASDPSRGSSTRP